MQKKGKNIMLFADSKAIAMATNHTMTVNPKLEQTATKDDALGPVADVDYVDWEISTAAVVGASGVTNEETYSTLISSQLAGENITAVFDAVDPDTADGAVPAAGWEGANSASEFPKMSGTALISEISIEAGADGFATMSVSLVANGALA